jgi:hypothetical protein
MIYGDMQNWPKTAGAILADLPSNYWQYLNQAICIKESILDSWTTTFSLRSTSAQSNLGDRAVKFLQVRGEGNRPRYQVATIYLSKFFAKWPTFSLGKTTHIRFVTSDENDIPTGFCILHIKWETESLLVSNLRFFSCSHQEKCEIIKNFQDSVNSIKHELRFNLEWINPIEICQKPIERLLIAYSPFGEDLIPEWALKSDPLSVFFVPQQSPSRNFLKRQSWIWFSDIKSLETSESLKTFQQNCFVALYNSKVNQGYLRIFEAPGTITFYKERIIGYSEQKPIFSSHQYVILWNQLNNFFQTEIWIEPSNISNSPTSETICSVYDSVVKEIFENVIFFNVRTLLSYHYYFLMNTHQDQPSTNGRKKWVPQPILLKM